MAPKRASPLDEPSSSCECEEEDEDEMPQSPSLSSDSEHSWVAKPKNPSPNLKRAKKNGEEHLSCLECRPRPRDREEYTSTVIGMPVSKSYEIEDVFKKGLELIGASKRAELDRRWNDLHVAQLELYIECVQLIADQAKLICEAYNSSNTIPGDK